MPSPTLAAVMIVCDEEANLRELASRYWHYFDEVIAVDGGSCDRSLDVARHGGARTYFRPLDNFAAQRNSALAKSTCDWCLSLDADERPTPALMREVRRRIARADAVAYRVPIRSTIFGRRFRYCGTQDDLPIRLFRRGAALWEGKVHEVLRVRGRVARLRQWLEHHTLPDLPSFLAKMNRYTRLEAASRVAENRAPRRHEIWSAPLVEMFRRLIWKHGWLDGPEGWAFCALSGLSAHVLAARHERLWKIAQKQALTETDVPFLAASIAPAPHAAALLSARAG